MTSLADAAQRKTRAHSRLIEATKQLADAHREYETACAEFREAQPATAPRPFQVGDVVKLGPKAQELHDVISRRYGAGRIRIRQHSTRVPREVAVSRLVLVRAADADEAGPGA
ncbi:hypothetical protein [Microbacterium sp. B24]|uniref:hypothetical protein n=1 Tax=Microbacterium sp. B24 TaxID=95616 RepID=UPI000404B823|nr:hypothetical protein [Microbacterium sp. B24]